MHFCNRIIQHPCIFVKCQARLAEPSRKRYPTKLFFNDKVKNLIHFHLDRIAHSLHSQNSSVTFGSMPSTANKPSHHVLLLQQIVHVFRHRGNPTRITSTPLHFSIYRQDISYFCVTQLALLGYFSLFCQVCIPRVCAQISWLSQLGLVEP